SSNSFSYHPDRAKQPSGIMARPALNLLFFKVSKTEHNPVIADSPDDFEGLLGVGPVQELMVLKEMIGEDRDVGTGVDIHPQIKRKISNDRSLGLNIENIVVRNDR